MRKSIFAILLLLSSPFSFLCAQNSNGSFSGDWSLIGSNFRFRFENGKVIMLEKNENGVYEIFNRGQEFQLKQSNLINKNNAQYTWINTCERCGWTETQSYLFSYVNKYVLRALKVTVVNNIGEVSNPLESWYTDKPKSYANATTHDLEPVYLLKKSKPSIGAASSRAMVIKEVAIHEKFTAIKFELQNTSDSPADFSLHPPGSDKAFQVRDMRGRIYNLIDEYGYGGFRRLTLAPNESRIFLCYFEPIPADTKTINIKEGTCSGELCWHFYDVDLQ